MNEIKTKWNRELEEPMEAVYEHRETKRADWEARRADRVTRWFVSMVCALALSAALHYMQALNLRSASKTIIALQKEVFDLQSKTSPAIQNFRKPFEKGGAQ